MIVQLLLIRLSAGAAASALEGDIVTTENAFFRRRATTEAAMFARRVTGEAATFRRTVTTENGER